jgi:hypothetical protein
MTMHHIKIADITNPDTNPIPEEAQELVAALLEGRVKSLAVVAEIQEQDGSTGWINEYWIDLEEHTSDRRGFVGTMHMVVHDMTEGINFDEQEVIEIDMDDLFGGDDEGDDDE